MSTKPHLLHIAPTPFFADRGCHIRIEGIVNCLSDLGYQNTVCTYHHGRDVQGINTKRISPIKAYTQTEAGPSRYKLWADWKLLWLVFKEYRRLKPVVIHAHLHEGLMIGLVIKLLFFWRRTPLIGDMQGSLTGELASHGALSNRGLVYRLTRLIERFLMWAADYIVCSSKHSLTKIQGEFNVPKAKISLAQDGADPAAIVSDAKVAQMKNKLGLPHDKTIVVYSGALLDSKGLTELKQTLKEVCKTPDVHFLIIGYPTEHLQSYLLHHDLSLYCTLTGRIKFEDLSEHLGLADIAIDPKSSDAGEGSGKILNYIAAALPVVAFETANNREFLPKGTSLAETTDQMVAQVLSYHVNHELRVTTGRRNLAHFIDNYSWSVTTEQLRKAYSVALN